VSLLCPGRYVRSFETSGYEYSHDAYEYVEQKRRAIAQAEESEKLKGRKAQTKPR
jgi:hypothetical protein